MAYTITFDGKRDSRWQRRDEACMVAERMVAGNPGHVATVHRGPATGPIVCRWSTREGVADIEPRGQSRRRSGITLFSARSRRR